MKIVWFTLLFRKPSVSSLGVVQTNRTGFNQNGESNLDLQFAMALVGKGEPVTLYQVGDLQEGVFVSAWYYSEAYAYFRPCIRRIIQ